MGAGMGANTGMGTGMGAGGCSALFCAMRELQARTWMRKSRAVARFIRRNKSTCQHC